MECVAHAPRTGGPNAMAEWRKSPRGQVHSVRVGWSPGGSACVRVQPVESPLILTAPF